jgi:LysM repeat protein
MNNTNPFVPQGSLMEQKNKQRARFKAAVIWVLALNFVLLIPGLLIQGCKDKDATADNQLAVPTNDVAMNPPQDTNFGAPPLTNTNVAVVPPAMTNPPTAVTPVPTGMATTYKIQQGDILYNLGRKFHVSVKAIVEANPGLDPKRLQVNKEITIPAPTTPPAAATGTTAATGAMADSSDMYKVKSGENLTIIAKSHGTTAKAIIALNNLKSDRIKAGDKLKLPAPKTATGTPATTGTPTAALDTTPTRAAGSVSGVTPASLGSTTGGTTATIR